MSKLKTKKTLSKRIKVSKTGKLIRKQINTGHLKAKWGSKKKFRKAKRQEQSNKGHVVKFKRMLGI